MTSWTVVLALVAGLVPMPGGLLGAAPAAAQERRMNLMDLLFGGAARQNPFFRKRNTEERARRIIVEPTEPRPTRRARTTRPNEESRPTRRASAPKARRERSRAAAPAVAAAPVPEAVEKADGAAKVLVAGDFLADDVRKGLEALYADNPNVVVVSETSGLSGLVRQDILDWSAEIRTAIDREKPAAVVFAIGMNDRQPMTTAEGRLEKLSPPWRDAYRIRVGAFAQAVLSRNVPLVWVGLPPVKSTSMTSDYLEFNGIVDDALDGGAAKFVDVWDGFTNADGRFVSAGPDVKGSIVRLRAADGINMTSAGADKLAFYADRELRPLLGPLTPGGTPVASLPDLQVIEDPRITGRTAAMALDSPQIDGGDALEGEGDFLASLAVSDSPRVADTLVTTGLGTPAAAGRIDATWGAAAPVPATLVDRKDQGARSALIESLRKAPSPDVLGPPLPPG